MELKSIRKVNLKKGDVIVLSTDRDLMDAEISRIREHFNEIFPDTKVILLEKMKLSVISNLPKVDPNLISRRSRATK